MISASSAIHPRPLRRGPGNVSSINAAQQGIGKTAGLGNNLCLSSMNFRYCVHKSMRTAARGVAGVGLVTSQSGFKRFRAVKKGAIPPQKAI
jgi:hypothetical protein